MSSILNTIEIKQIKSVSNIKTNISLYRSIILQPDIVHVTDTPNLLRVPEEGQRSPSKGAFFFFFFFQFKTVLHSLQPVCVSVFMHMREK